MKVSKIILISDAAFDQCLEDCKSWLDEEDFAVLTEDETKYLINLVCQQEDSFEMVHRIIKKLGGYV